MTKSTLSNTIIKDNAGSEYRVVQETCYHIDTPDRVILLLEQSRQNKTRLLITYGDTKTGKPWGDTVRCHVGRSTGKIKIPLEILTSRSMGGSGLLDNCIVKIEYSDKRDGKSVLYDITK